MLRAAGVPARYVEGYVVRPEDFSRKDGKPETVEIKDKASHAWVEIYVDGVGWIPYELTPSDSNAVEEPEETDVTTTAPPITAETAAPPVSETKPPVTTIISGTPDQNAETEVTVPIGGEEVSEPTEPVSYDWIWWMGTIALILSILVLRRLIVLKKRSKSFRTKDTNQNIRQMYSYLESLLKFIGLSNVQALPYLEYADYVDKNLSQAVRKNSSDENELSFDTSFKTVMEIALAAGFGENTISEEKQQLVYRFTAQLCDEIYKELSAIQKLWFMFGLNLK